MEPAPATGVHHAANGVFLYWIPLGAGGSGFVRLNGLVYEVLVSRRERRRPLDLYHTALEVRLPEGRHVVETMWPVPDLDGVARGAVVAGPVFARWLSFTRVFRYEIRCWRDGVLPDADAAVGGAQLITPDTHIGRRILGLTRSVPVITWGREPPGVDEMWNSNSVISWLLAKGGVDLGVVVPPHGGRAPGWSAGMTVSRW